MGLVNLKGIRIRPVHGPPNPAEKKQSRAGVDLWLPYTYPAEILEPPVTMLTSRACVLLARISRPLCDGPFSATMVNPPSPSTSYIHFEE